jgi:hypothetical protein
MSGPRYEPLSQAEDTAIIHKNSYSLPKYEPQVPQTTQQVYDAGSSSDDEDEEERMKLQAGESYSAELYDDIPHPHKGPVSIHPFTWSCALLIIMTGSARKPCNISSGVWEE